MSGDISQRFTEHQNIWNESTEFVSQLQSEITKLNEKNRLLSEKLENHKNLDVEFKVLKRELEEYKVHCGEIVPVDPWEEQTQICRDQQDYIPLPSEIHAAIQSKHSRVSETKDIQDKEIHQLKHQLSELSEERNQKEKAQEAVKKLESELEASKKQNDRQRIDIFRVRTTLAGEKSKTDDLERRNTVLNEENQRLKNHLKANIQDAAKKINSTPNRGGHEELTRRNKELREENTKLYTDKAKLEEEVERLRERSDQLDRYEQFNSTLQELPFGQELFGSWSSGSKDDCSKRADRLEMELDECQKQLANMTDLYRTSRKMRCRCVEFGTVDKGVADACRQIQLLTEENQRLRETTGFGAQNSIGVGEEAERVLPRRSKRETVPTDAYTKLAEQCRVYKRKLEEVHWETAHDLGQPHQQLDLLSQALEQEKRKPKRLCTDEERVTSS